jgi:hypothetical protein
MFLVGCLGKAPTIYEKNQFLGWLEGNFPTGSPCHDKELQNQFEDYMTTKVIVEVPVKHFHGQVYKDSLNAPCPECGYKYGSAWLHEPLPQEIIDFVEGLE